MGARWTRADDGSVDAKWGEEALASTAGRVERTVDAVRSRYYRRGLSARATSGRETFSAVAKRTGYNWRDVARAVSELSIRPKRTCFTPRGRWNLLSEEQVERVLAYLGDETRREAEMWVAVEEVARHADCSRATVYRWVGAVIVRGRVPRDRLEQVLLVLRRRGR